MNAGERNGVVGGTASELAHVVVVVEVGVAEVELDLLADLGRVARRGESVVVGLDLVLKPRFVD
jgi:hypothetical protein